MSEGRNRQIRRTFSALGYQTIRLHRTEFRRDARRDRRAPGYRKRLPAHSIGGAGTNQTHHCVPYLRRVGAKPGGAYAAL